MTPPIRSALDGKAPESSVCSGTFLDSANYSPESVLPPSFLLQHSEPEEIERVIPKKIARIREVEDEPPPRSSRMGLIASIAVGLLVAVFLFPVIRLLDRSTRSYVKESLTSEIGRRIDQYEQINSNSSIPVEVMLPINLALSGWQELRTDVLAPQEIIATPTAPPLNEEKIIPPPPSLLDAENEEEAIPKDNSNLLEHKSPFILVQENGVHSAYGEYFHFKDGRIFFRDLR